MEGWSINPPAGLTTLSLPNQQFEVAAAEEYGALTKTLSSHVRGFKTSSFMYHEISVTKIISEAREEGFRVT